MTQLEFSFDEPSPTASAVGLSGPIFPARQQAEASPASDLPRYTDERGYREFVSERQEAIARMEVQFGLVLHRRVRMTLAGFPGEFTGVMMLDQLIPPHQRGDELRLRIGEVRFEARDLESCVVV
ncbi:MAG TPA: hypothetical protein PKE26_06400 [Kiritimatiellia bacterium]|nr:hypothetical protein [Kiritimatiellia bacterium]HMO98724.1 hypothetical protein [Kiritimatiellia bacterium]HMP96884.1 hypothetical protein [Kiritimatiellia bacterium]